MNQPALAIKTRSGKKEKEGELWPKGAPKYVGLQLSCLSQISVSSGHGVEVAEECFHVAA